jgi:dipeptidyl aminopeptidase/acylaminoacyl peptidase
VPDIDIARFADYPRLGEVSVSPNGTAIVYISTGPDRQNGHRAVWRRDIRTGATALLWSGELSASRCLWSPDGTTILVAADHHGRENHQLLELDAHSGAVTWHTAAPTVRHEINWSARCGNQPYSPDARWLAFSRNQRDPSAFDVVLRDRVDGSTSTVLVGDDRYHPVCWSPDGTSLLIHCVRQNLHHDLFVYRRDDDTAVRVTPSGPPARYLPGGWSADGRAVYLATDQGRDHAGLARLELSGTPRLTWLATPEHGVDHVALSPERNHLLRAVNIDGYTELSVHDLRSGADRVVRGLPRGVAAKEMGRFGFAPTLGADGATVTAVVARATAPPEVYQVGLADDRAVRLTECGGTTPDPERLVEPEVVRYPSADGLSVPALLYRPRTTGNRVPVVVSIHGGPEYQAFPEYDPLHHILLSRGVGVLAPNYRGSTGFGAAYQRRIYRDRGGGDLADLHGAATYLRGLDWVDGARLGLYGESYGGFAVLSAVSRLPGLWAAAAELCGRSDLVGIASATPRHWHRRLADWVGDAESDTDLLSERSPITHAHRIQAPLLVGHGANDPRVPRTESDRLVARLRELGKPVRYLLFEDEGHVPADGRHARRWLTEAATWLLHHLTGQPADLPGSE